MHRALPSFESLISTRLTPRPVCADDNPRCPVGARALPEARSVTGQSRVHEKMFKNLTGYEIDTLPQTYNLTDGHAFRRWFAAEAAIIDRAGQLFKNNSRQQQVEIE